MIDAKSPCRKPLPSRFVSCTSWYAADGTAVSESFWSVSVSSPSDCTGFGMNTDPTPVVLPDPGFVAAAPATIVSAASTATIATPVLRMDPPLGLFKTDGGGYKRGGSAGAPVLPPASPEHRAGERAEHDQADRPGERAGHDDLDAA